VLRHSLTNAEFPDAILRLIRASIGTFLIFIIVTSFVVPHVLAVSGKSIVNAKLEWIRTPINGSVSFNNIRLGDSVSKGDLLGVVSNERAEDTLLNSLRLEKSALDTSIFTLEKRHQQLTEQRRELAASVYQSLLQLREQTKVQINTTETELLLSEKKHIQLKEKIQRYESANREFSKSEPYSVVSRAILDEHHSQITEVDAYTSKQQDTLTMLKSDLHLAIAGEFTSKNTPPEQLKLNDVEQAITAITAEKQALLMKSNQLLADVEARTVNLGLVKQNEFTARVNGVLWDIGYADGSYVNNGDSLVAIADTDSLVIECIFHQRYLDNIHIGDFATINLMGSGEKLTGRVKKVLIRDPVRTSDLNAFKFNSPENNEFKVMISLDGDQTPRIGQRAKVVISKNKSSPISKILMTLSR